MMLYTITIYIKCKIFRGKLCESSDSKLREFAPHFTTNTRRVHMWSTHWQEIPGSAVCKNWAYLKVAWISKLYVSFIQDDHGR